MDNALAGKASRLRLLAFAVAFLIGAATGMFASRWIWPPADPAENSDYEVRASGYKYIRPLLECEIGSGKGRNRELVPFRDEVAAVVNSQISSGKAERVSVYFRDMNNGPWFSVNPEQDFIPASLLKVPTMMSVFRIAEKNPDSLQEKIRLPPDMPNNWGQTYFPEKLLKPGGEYTVEELVNRMIIYSDNGATWALNNLLPRGTDTQTFRDLGVSFRSHDGHADWISVETYASFFRVLYNASYLSRDMSEKALGIMSHSEFAKGVRAGVPANIPVAHKFGHFHYVDHNGESEQLHSCGIVYHKDHPYLICIMTRGEKLPGLEEAIAAISEEVFRQVDREHHLGDPPKGGLAVSVGR